MSRPDAFTPEHREARETEALTTAVFAAFPVAELNRLTGPFEVSGEVIAILRDSRAKVRQYRARMREVQRG